MVALLNRVRRAVSKVYDTFRGAVAVARFCDVVRGVSRPGGAPWQQARSLDMRLYWHIILITSCLIAGFGAGVSPSQADGYNGHRQYGGHGDRHGSGHGYRSGYRHGYGPSYGYRPGYRRGYSYYSLGYGYGPGYGYDYGYGWGIGYGYSGGHHGGHGSSFDLFFSAPLYLGPSYYSQPATVIVP